MARGGRRSVLHTVQMRVGRSLSRECRYLLKRGGGSQFPGGRGLVHNSLDNADGEVEGAWPPASASGPPSQRRPGLAPS